MKLIWKLQPNQAASGFWRRLVMKVVMLGARSCAFLVFGTLNYAFPYIFFTNSSFHYLGLNNLLMAYEDKSAYAMCVFSLALGPTMEPITFMGKTPVWLTFPNYTS